MRYKYTAAMNCGSLHKQQMQAYLFDISKN
ncbi:hypothetical protein SAMN05444128_0419 [Pontibacter indicus]|uniref:Uncharacterized protein n=1 Tax=Pontibacter indicus TaxID=1317125 RepID=A0A1R3WG82_9BACT|nr:hypothetical protein SAMN05444128_0419 [Pontibacter indicus]